METIIPTALLLIVGSFIVFAILIGVSDVSKAADERAKKLKIEANKSKRISKSHKKAITSILRRVDFAFPKIVDTYLIQTLDFDLYTFDFVTHNKRAYYDRSAMILEIGKPTQLQFCVTRHISGFRGGDEIEKTKLPEWARGYSIRSVKKFKKSTINYFEANHALIGLTTIIGIDWLFVLDDKIIVYFEKIYPADDQYFERFIRIAEKLRSIILSEE